MRGPIPKLTLEDFKSEMEEILAPEFGAMTSTKAVMSDAGYVPDWKVRASLGKFLKGQVNIKKREKKRTRKRQRDIDRDKLKGIVDARTG